MRVSVMCHRAILSFAHFVAVALLPCAIACTEDKTDGQPPPQQCEPGLQTKGTNAQGRDVYVNSIGMRLVRIPAGDFEMGGELRDDEKPRHHVKLTEDFLLGETQVTQAQYETVMGKNPSRFRGADRPVEQVSWDDAKEFCKKLGELEKAEYCLPTEAEWEYACRAGTKTQFYWGDNEGFGVDYAWYGRNSGDETHPVKQKRPTAWGVYDMVGNVLEWCEDWYDEKAYETRKDGATDPCVRDQGACSGRVARGCAWDDQDWALRACNRSWLVPGGSKDFLGFRIARCPSAR